MLRDLLSGGTIDWTLLVSVPAILLTIMLHEIAHGLTAKRLGDPTAQKMGRLTLNPIPHIDIMGLIMMIFVGFGWAKPVPVDMRYFKKPKRDFALVALAGPVTNFLIAFVSLFLMYLIAAVFPGAYGWVVWSSIMEFSISPIQYFFLFLAVISIGLGLFNLFPFPPLDGSKIIGALFPERIYYKILRYERYGMLFLVALMLVSNYIPALDVFAQLAVVRDFLYTAFDSVIRGFFSLFGTGVNVLV